MKIRKPEFARTYVYNMLIVIIVIVVILDSLWIYQAYEELESKAKHLRSSYIDKQRILIKNDVVRIANYIDYCKSIITREEKTKLSSRFNNLFNRAENLYKKNEGLPMKEIKEKILNLIYSKMYNNNEYYTLVYSLDKGSFKLGAEPDNYKYDKPFTVNAETIKELIGNYNKINLHSNDYLWHIQGGGAFKSVNSNKLEYIKLGVIRYFKPLNIYIILCAYTGDLAQKIQSDILNWIDELKFPADQYFFIDKYDRTPLIYDGKKVSDKKLGKMSDKILDTYSGETNRIINSSGSGYIYYPIPNKKSTGLYHKISYIQTMDDWEWIVGAGVYMEDIEFEINIMRQNLELKTIYNIITILFILFAFIVVSLLVARFIIRKAQKNFNSFYDFFDQSAANSVMIDPDSQAFREFEMLANSVNSMIRKRLQIEEALKESENKFKDIAERLESLVESRTRELAEKQAQLIHSGRLVTLGEMAAGMAHEINQPLSTIKFALDNLEIAVKEDKFDNEYLKKKSKKVNLAVNKISNIINHVRIFSREQVSHNDKAEKFKIKQSINNAIQLVGEQFKNSNIELKVTGIGTDLITVGEVYKLEQVIINLLSNARDAVLEKASTETDDFKMKVSIKAAIRNNEIIEIIVEDNGIGIRPDLIEKVLNPFYTTKEVGKGTGLGLSISYGIIQEMNGDIRFNSDVNGTQAIINLPLKSRSGLTAKDAK